MKSLGSIGLLSCLLSGLLLAGVADGAVTSSRKWQIPRHDRLQHAGDVAVDGEGAVFVAMDAMPRKNRAHIWKYSEEGRLIGRFPVEMRVVESMAFDPDGTLLLVGSGVLRYRTDGTLVGDWKTWGDNRSPVYSGSSGISIDSRGDVYATSTQGNVILRLDRKGRIKREFRYREKSGRPREFYDVAVAPDDSIYATDDSFLVHHFAADGRHLGKFGGRGAAPGRFEWSYEISVGPDGTVLVMDDFYGRLQAFDPEGRLLDGRGGFGTLPGSFGNWSVFGMDSSEGAVYLVEAGGRLHRFQVDSLPPVPASLLTYRTVSWNNPVKAGGRARFRFRVRNLGSGPATGVQWCVPAGGKGTKLIVERGCRDLGTIPARSSKRFRVTVEIPANKRGHHRIEVMVTSDQTGPGPTFSNVEVRQPNRKRSR